MSLSESYFKCKTSYTMLHTTLFPPNGVEYVNAICNWNYTSN